MPLRLFSTLLAVKLTDRVGPFTMSAMV